MPSYDRRKIASLGAKLDSKIRQSANAALIRAGLDGNGRFRKIGLGLAAALEVLGKYGIESDETLSAHKFPEAGGRATVDLAFSNKSDLFSPESISNTVLAIQWTELQPGRVEVIAYLS